MLSQDLRSLAAWFNACRAGTHEMTGEGAQAFALALEDAVAQAEALESRGALRPGDVADLNELAATLATAANVLFFPVRERSPFTDAPFGGAA